MQFYERLKELREDKDLTQAEIAQIIGVGQSYYSKQERNDKPFKIEQIVTLCEFYGVSADYVLGLPEGLRWPRPGRKQGYRIRSDD